MTAREARALERRRAAAARYRPAEVDLLLVAEAPPKALDRYFYFDDVREHDNLFRYVCRAVLNREPERDKKPDLLGELRPQGVFLVDLQETPVDGTLCRGLATELVERCRRLNPRRVILIKATVYDAAYLALEAAGLPVVAVRIPFPGSGRQREFEVAFRRALDVGAP